MDSIIDFLIVISLLYTSYILYSISNKKKDNKLLLKMISLFILIHLVVFPLVYTYMVNTNPESIEIDNNILSFEKEVKIKGLEFSYNWIDINNQKIIIESIINTDSELLEESNIYWADYYNSFDDNDFTNFITVKNQTLVFYERHKETPSTPYGRFILIYPKDEKYKTFELNGDFNMKAIDILKENLIRLKLLEEKKINQLKIIKSNKFWSYKQVLPYTINILFTDSFKPKSRFSNIVYFIHNLVVAIFLLSFIVSLSQNYLNKK